MVGAQVWQENGLQFSMTPTYTTNNTNKICINNSLLSDFNAIKNLIAKQLYKKYGQCVAYKALIGLG